MFTPEKLTVVSESQLRVAFDGDAVLFSDESERIYKAHGLDKFFEHEKAHENITLDHVSLKESSKDTKHGTHCLILYGTHLVTCRALLLSLSLH